MNCALCGQELMTAGCTNPACSLNQTDYDGTAVPSTRPLSGLPPYFYTLDPVGTMFTPFERAAEALEACAKQLREVAQFLSGKPRNQSWRSEPIRILDFENPTTRVRCYNALTRKGRRTLNLRTWGDFADWCAKSPDHNVRNLPNIGDKSAETIMDAFARVRGPEPREDNGDA